MEDEIRDVQDHLSEIEMLLDDLRAAAEKEKDEAHKQGYELAIADAKSEWESSGTYEEVGENIDNLT